MTIDQAERDRLRAARERAGWDQKELARRAVVTPATISNLEGGRSRQVKKIVYAKIIRALRAPSETVNEDRDQVFTSAVEAIAALDVDDTEMVAAFARRLAEKAAKVRES